ncbi:hypothetical protein BUH_5672 [Burkholderia pseudomallei Pakistan 9]|nr:hypothetical protein BUH_5672 [Burkholderia pseudomallei Pakistan 9]
MGIGVVIHRSFSLASGSGKRVLIFLKRRRGPAMYAFAVI